MCVCACARVCACMHACMHVCKHACVRAHASVCVKKYLPIVKVRGCGFFTRSSRSAWPKPFSDIAIIPQQWWFSSFFFCFPKISLNCFETKGYWSKCWRIMTSYSFNNTCHRLYGQNEGDVLIDIQKVKGHGLLFHGQGHNTQLWMKFEVKVFYSLNETVQKTKHWQTGIINSYIYILYSNTLLFSYLPQHIRKITFWSTKNSATSFSFMVFTHTSQTSSLNFLPSMISIGLS